MLFIINGAGLIFFPPGRIEFFAKEWTKNSQRFALWGIAARNIFLVFEKGKTFFLKIKKEHSTKK
jgi:hypothetical protein